MLVPIPNEDPGTQGSQCGPVNPNGPDAALRAKSGPIAVSSESLLVPKLTCNVNTPSFSATMVSAHAATGNGSAANAMTRTIVRSGLSDVLVACAMLSVLRRNAIPSWTKKMGQVRSGSQIFVNTPFGQPPMVRPHQTLVLTLAAQIDGRASSQFSETRGWPGSSRSAVLSLRYGLFP